MAFSPSKREMAYWLTSEVGSRVDRLQKLSADMEASNLSQSGLSGYLVIQSKAMLYYYVHFPPIVD